MGRSRVWLERIGIGFIACVALTAPFVFGFVYYLGITDGIEINMSDPLRESRIWMQKERRGPTGIGWLYTAPTGTPQEGLQCAQTQLTMLNWKGGLSLDTSVNYCKCYESGTGGLKESAVPCR